MQERENTRDVIVIGGGQAGLAVGYYLRRTELDFTILDDREAPGGAWRGRWETLRLFSPAEHSSLPGWPMPRAQAERYGSFGEAPSYPSREDTVGYLRRYEERYDLPVERPVRVESVRHEDEGYVLRASDGSAWRARAVVSATGTEAAPHVPTYPGQDAFRGEQMHSSQYRSPMKLMAERVVVVGGGNSGAQIMAEVSGLAEAMWATREEPTFLPPEVDGRVLFAEATARYEAQKAGRRREPAYSLGNVVQTGPVREAKEAGRLEAHPMFERFTHRGVVWPGGEEEPVDAVIWATGFGAALGPLGPLDLAGKDGRVQMEGTRARGTPRLWLVGYGHWTGFASATLIGVGRTARRTAREVEAALSGAPRERTPA